MARFRAGDRREAFEALVRPHLGSIVALARRVVRDRNVADELVQEALVRAFHGLDGFRGDASLRTWLLTIVSRLGADPRRWQRAVRADLRDFGPDCAIPDGLASTPPDEMQAREMRDRLDEALERLSARQRAALHLRAFEGMDYAGISAALECSPGAARMLVLEARRKVAARLGRHLEP